ncbi:hypothetical protein WT36_26950 [Burkholderia territorii]|nr:hypothetical protein WT36_26950 [Burkholderia territorii]KWA26972.1 hypothetical protein WT39_18685 [Burkholderia territorii]
MREQPNAAACGREAIDAVRCKPMTIDARRDGARIGGAIRMMRTMRAARRQAHFRAPAPACGDSL